MDRSTVCVAVLIAAVIAGACNYKSAGSSYSGTDGGRGGVGGTGGAGGMGGMGGTGGVGGAAGTGRGGTGPLIIIDAGGEHTAVTCGGKSKTGMKVAPDILILLDRSGSMNECLMPDAGMNTNCGANSKWAQLIPAITQVVSQTDTEVNWGLKFFPDNGGTTTTCNVSTMPEVRKAAWMVW